GPLTELALRSRARFADVAAERHAATGVDIGHRVAGVLAVCLEPDDVARLEARYGWQHAAGQRLEWLRGDELRAREPALDPAIERGLWFPDDGQVDPRAYLRALALAAAKAGVRFVTGAYVRRVVHDGRRAAGVEAKVEQVPAGTAAIASASWST